MCTARVNSFEKLYSPLPLEERDFDAAEGRQKAAPGEGLNRVRYLVRPRTLPAEHNSISYGMEEISQDAC